MNIRDAYNESLAREGHVRDEAQLAVVARLEELADRLAAPQPRRGRLHRLLSRNGPRETRRGLYIWGGVGRGKTFLMDLFFASLDTRDKKRAHFHRMMKDVHDRLKGLGHVENPVDKVAAQIAAEVRVLCFDEFFVSDIGDAMILHRLLEGLFARGVTLVATSNSHPDDLYRDGLQRQRFLPAIDLLRRCTEIVNLGGCTDYRLRLLQKAGTYLTPDDAGAAARLESFFAESASTEVREETDLDINGRPVRACRCAKGIAWFRFGDVCDGPRSQADYIEIARWYPSVIISGVPRFDRTREDQARRFIALVDEFYDRRVKLILSASVDAHSLYAGRKLAFEFDRTVSRLMEMQTTDYLALPHLA
ncbi:MAG: cell division protein ZapE [Woeseiaceae bacterium]|nr:AFG1 family ATPase [Gammaproteobacteria bacterium]NNF48238.1 cell division protein ZapE [Woeseiaceae bacterium]NNK25489.1 cell division protein ZapE [Woeseiaceae bacterium]NNL63705.1 cell division protein ZapE [Woeseiaceae bacterium]